MTKTRILVLCTGNSARSQMAEGLFRAAGGVEAFSAGVRPSAVRPEAIAAMREIGIDISGQRSKSVDEFAGASFDYVITVCDNARDACPVFPGRATRIHWSFEDPAAVEGSERERLDAFRRTRDRLQERIKALLADPAAELRTATEPRQCGPAAAGIRRP
jgi:arsenate reductase